MVRSAYLIAVISVLLIWAGCQDFENPVAHVDRAVESEQGLSFIKLPDPGGLFKQITESTVISPQTGGSLSVNYSQGEGQDKVDIEITLSFQPGSVSEPTEITMTVDEDFLMTSIDMTFGPSGTSFLKPGSLNVKTLGLDFSELPEDAEVKLYYYNGQSDQWEEINAKQILLNRNVGRLQCVDGEIPHFSRYGFMF